MVPPSIADCGFGIGEKQESALYPKLGGEKHEEPSGDFNLQSAICNAMRRFAARSQGKTI
jgi:hypothetical protein